MAGDDDGVLRGAVAEADAQGGDVIDDVLVGDDVAAGIDDDAGAHAVDRFAAMGGENASPATPPASALAVDVDDGPLDALDRRDDGGSARTVRVSCAGSFKRVSLVNRFGP